MTHRFRATIARLTIVIAALIGLAFVYQDIVRDVGARSEVPDGCDAFGYLRAAQLFKERGIIGGLDTSITGTAPDAVIRAAKRTGLPVSEWLQAIAPPCHHYDERSDRIIDQYPPGIGAIYSLFPAGFQMRGVLIGSLSIVFIVSCFGAVVAVSLVRAIAFVAAGFLTILAIYHEPNAWSAWPAVVACMFVAYCTAATFRSRATARPLMFAVLGLACGIAVNFRIANGFLLFGLCVPLLIEFCSGKFRWATVCGTLLMMGALVGAVPTIAANWINAGSPFATTYAAGDTQLPMIAVSVIADNLKIYMANTWTMALMALFFAGTVLALGFRSRFQSSLPWVMAANLAFTVAYFATHVPTNSYYVLPVAAWGAYTFAYGWRSRPDDPRGKRSVGFTLVTLGCTAAIVAVVLLRTPPTNRDPIFDRNPLPFTLPPNSVVWAEATAGLFVYFNTAYAAKLDFAAPAVADALIKSLAASGIPQFVVADTPVLVLLVQRQAGSKLVGRFRGHDVFALDSAAPP